MDWTGKRIKVIFNDGISTAKKEGLCTRDNLTEIVLDDKQLIPKNRIIRAEVV